MAIIFLSTKFEVISNKYKELSIIANIHLISYVYCLKYDLNVK